MSVYLRNGSSNYMVEFVFNGRRYQKSSRTRNKRAAEQIEAQWKIELAKGAAGIVSKPTPPTFRDFAPRFLAHIATKHEKKPKTVTFYTEQMQRLLDYSPLAKARLDSMDEVIEGFIQQRRARVKISTVNRGLATLRNALRLAYKWKVVDRVPSITLIPGEQGREFVLSHTQERIYLEFASNPLRDLALLVLDTGVRVGEALALRWTDVQLENLGTIHIRQGKSRYAKRTLPITFRVREMLQSRQAENASEYVFCSSSGGPLVVSSLDHMHSKLRKQLNLSKEFVLHSLRHTYLTRLGESGADAFTIMKAAGHHSITVSQRYVHPSQEQLESAVSKLDEFNRQRRQPVTDHADLQEVPAFLPAPKNAILVSH